ncbi:MAG: alanine racemase [Bacillus sp. (in: firmicutes)]
MCAAFYRDTWAEINLDHIYDNVSAMKQYIRDDMKLCAVVKANGYGHGAYEVAQIALEAGAEWLAVAFLDEAIALRKKGIEVPILILGAIRACDAGLAAEHNISVTVFSNEWLQEAESYIPNNTKLPVHIKCDTGMGRLGYRDGEQMKRAEQLIVQSSAYTLEGCFTHFATADEIDTEYYEMQYEKFIELLGALSKLPALIHSSNSASSFRFEKAWFNGIRLGISMYGLSPSSEMKELLPYPLKEALTLHTKIVNVKQIEAGASVSYGATYQADKQEWIATLPIGYADGWIRKLSGQEVIIDGIRMPIVGRVCMDQCMVRLPKHYPVGTPVTLIGKDGNESVSVDEIAERLQTINYEVICSISSRVPRVYKRNGIIQSVSNTLL